MNLSVAYLGRSRIWTGPAGVALSLEPNLRRDRVSYVGTLHQPLRFREAVMPCTTWSSATCVSSPRTIAISRNTSPA